jgi:hypothetical protein
MPLPWVRLDTSMPTNPKVIRLVRSHPQGGHAAFVWLCSLTYSGFHGLDGFIDRTLLDQVHAKPVHARLLVEHQFWKDVGHGWMIHDWSAFQESSVETQARSQRMQDLANRRWHPEQEPPASARGGEIRRAPP